MVLTPAGVWWCVAMHRSTAREQCQMTHSLTLWALIGNPSLTLGALIWGPVACAWDGASRRTLPLIWGPTRLRSGL